MPAKEPTYGYELRARLKVYELTATGQQRVAAWLAEVSAVPASIGARQPVAPIPQSEAASLGRV
jgi:DNA-binding PadR family transcriptional regulator